MNKKIVVTAIISIMAISFFASCGARRTAIQDPATYDVGVVINGVRWATRNVSTPGNFVGNPESKGELFTFDEAQNVCPPGWRLPTYEELQSLNRVSGVWAGNGRIFGTAPNQLFLPASGWRRDYDGSVFNVGANGLYWSSTQSNSELAMFLGFNNGNVLVYGYWRESGFSVRCVAE